MTKQELDKKAILMVSHINTNKNFIILEYWSPVFEVMGSRVGDPPHMNDRSRFVKVDDDVLQNIKKGDFILFPSNEKLRKSEYKDKNGNDVVANWLLEPRLNKNDFFDKELIYSSPNND